jgi:hypothetical protein
MNGKNPTIIDFIKVFDLMGKIKISPAQCAILKSFYGLLLDDIELDIFKRGTGRELYIPTEHSELTLIAGRQSGKTSVVAASIGLFEAFQDHDVPPGQRAYVLIIAPVLEQASTAFRFISRYILNSPILSQSVLKLKQNEIELKNGVVIACRACSYSSVRGVPVICTILDELAFWRHKDNSANPESEVIAAIRPAMATLSNTKLIKISTPFRKEGTLWSEFQYRGQLPYYVWQVTSEEMNPTISKSFLDKARAADEDTFRREHLAEFVDSNCEWIASELLEHCIMHGRRELPRVFHGTYAAAIDPAFQSNDFGFAILHRSDRGDVSVACALRWTGTKAIHLDFAMVCEQIRMKLDQYGINSLVGDQYCFAMLKQHFSRLNIFYRELSFGTGTRGSLFGNLRQLIIQRKIAIIDDPELLHQLRSLEEIRTANGNIDIRPARSSKDDVAIAVALAASELSEAVPDQYVPVILGNAETGPTIRYDAYGYPVGQGCEKFPVCFKYGNTCECYGC